MRPAMRFVKSVFGDREIIGAEVGVFRARHAAQILNRMPTVKMLYLIDPYEVYEGYDDANMHLVPRAKNHAKKHLERLGFDKDRYKWIYERFTADVIPVPLDFIYIDGSHQYSHVKFDIKEARKVVKKGGVISGHDYYPEDDTRRPDLHGVGRAVREEFGNDFSYGKKDWWALHI
jgi:hypothetical protein